MFERLHATGLITDEVRENYDAMPPPAYVAPIVTWLCTDQASGISGEVFHAKGNLMDAGPTTATIESSTSSTPRWPTRGRSPSSTTSCRST
jgi:hypothetical protein